MTEPKKKAPRKTAGKAATKRASVRAIRTVPAAKKPRAKRTAPVAPEVKPKAKRVTKTAASEQAAPKIPAGVIPPPEPAKQPKGGPGKIKPLAERIAGAKPGAPRHRSARMPPGPDGKIVLTPLEETFSFRVAAGEKQSAVFAELHPQSAEWKSSSIHTKAHELVNRPHVRARIAELLQKAAEHNNITIAEIIADLQAIRRADIREIVTHVVDCCRHCYGKRGAYQWTPAELKRAQDKRQRERSKDNSLPDIDASGGTGYDPRLPPRAECQECHGRGEANIIFGDMRNASPEALALFAGIKQGKDGKEVKLHDRMEAVEKLAKHIGFYERHNEQLAGTIANKQELDAIYDRKLRAGLERSAAAKGRLSRLGIKEGD
jgi:phage terminase small subunit